MVGNPQVEYINPLGKWRNIQPQSLHVLPSKDVVTGGNLKLPHVDVQKRETKPGKWDEAVLETRVLVPDSP